MKTKRIKYQKAKRENEKKKTKKNDNIQIYICLNEWIHVMTEGKILNCHFKKKTFVTIFSYQYILRITKQIQFYNTK